MSSIGERLKQARLAAGLSQRALAEAAEPLSAMAISKYENDKAVPSSDVLLRLAKALKIKVAYFFRQIKVELARPQYRKHSRLPAKVQKSVENQIIEILERYLAVEQAFGPDRFHKFEVPRAASTPVECLADAEGVADALRDEWGLGEDPIDNLCETLEDKGVKVILLEPIDKFEGWACWTTDGIPVVTAPKVGPRARQRLTLAHELGHLLLDVADDVDEERAAYRFGAAFLVPASAAKWEYGSRRGRLSDVELRLLKGKWGLSMGAWVYRLHDLGIISDSVYRRAQITFRQLGWHRQEPDDEEGQMDAETSSRFERLVAQALAEDLISVAKAAEYLGRPLTEVRRTMVAYEGAGVF